MPEIHSNIPEMRHSIQKLDDHVIDQIAAGEVVERPAQLVKEVIENSIDAGATEIVLSVDSDLSSIAVKDNGAGISKKDLDLVFERHSTSKIRNADELFHLSSFGFRGEALSAIGSVAQIRMETKNQNEDQGSLVEWTFGEKTLESESQVSTGTEMKISRLFENVPARKKFLKSDKFELLQIKKVFYSFALIHFDKEFKFLVDGKLKEFYQKKKSPDERYSQVYPKKKLYKVPLRIESEVFDEGTELWLEEPSFETKNSSGLWVFVQDRWIQDKTVVAAVRDGLSTYLMHGTFPKGVLFLNFVPKFVDVNVHPMKSQVRFAESSKVYSFLRKNVTRWAEDSPWLENTIANAPSTPQFVKVPSAEPVSYPAVKDHKPQLLKNIEQDFNKTQYKKTELIMPEKRPIPTFKKVSESLDATEPLWGSLQVLGQTNLTYIIAQSSEALFLIDQHAAHERVGYEKLLRSWKSNETCETQALLLPLQLDLPEEQLESLLERKEELLKFGIEFERTGPESLALTLIPSFLKEEAVIKAVEFFAQENLAKGGSGAIEDAFKLLFATMSCHSVIRAGHAMALDEMKLLLHEMDQYKSSYCPHGRPVYKKIPFSELDRDFGRTL